MQQTKHHLKTKEKEHPAVNSASQTGSYLLTREKEKQNENNLLYVQSKTST